MSKHAIDEVYQIVGPTNSFTLHIQLSTEDVASKIHTAIKRVCEYVPRWVRDLYILDKQDDEDTPGAMGKAIGVVEAGHGFVGFYEEIEEMSEQVFYDTLIHELLHLQLAEMDGMIKKLIELGGRDNNEPFVDAMEHQRLCIVERTIDGLARAGCVSLARSGAFKYPPVRFVDMHTSQGEGVSL